MLTLSARTQGMGQARVDELLSLVGLAGPAAKRRVRGYSLGMRQRLGIAHALLGDPRVLILDEPANGLDPEGIFWMRGLLRDFADRGGTVLLSSHLLREVEAVADRLVVIGGGRIVANGSKEELLAAGGVRVRALDPGTLQKALERAGLAGDRERRRCADRAGRGGAGRAGGGQHLGRPAGAAPGRHRRTRRTVPDPDRRRGQGDRAMTATMTETRTPMAAPRTFARPGLVRLTGIELRKMADTRAGFWLMVATALISVAIVVIQLFAADPSDLNFKNLFQSTLFPVAVLLPVLGILSVTSEWTQRTALTTFALTPQRQRIVIAKAFASVVLGILALVPSLAFAAIGNVIAGGMDGASGSWSFGGLLLGYALLFNVVNVLFGLGFGMLFMNSAVAIVLYFVVPTIWSVLTNMISGLHTTSEWLDLSVTSTPLFEDAALTGGEWAKLAASIGLWVVLPSVLGLVRLLKREVS